jgi:hypothetical protein
MTRSQEPSQNVEDAATPIIGAIQEQADDLRALSLGLGGVILLIWIAGVLAGLQVGNRICCGRGLVSILEFGGPGILSALVTTALVVSSVALWTARSREARTLREEWHALSIDSASILSAHLLERAGAWRDALRRNLEASVVGGILLPLMVFLLVFSIAVGSPGVSPPVAWIITLALTLGCGTFAGFQVGTIALSVRSARSGIERHRRGILETLKESGGTRVGPHSVPEGDGGESEVTDRRLVTVEEALLGRERDSQRTAATERRIGAVIIAGAAVAVLLMATASAWDLAFPHGSTSYQYGVSHGDAGAGVVLGLIGFVGVLWASRILRRSRTEGPTGVTEPLGASPSGLALARIDGAVGQLDRARATAARGRNAVVLSAVLVVVRLWFVPGYSGVPTETLGIANVLLSDLALPLALLVVLWAAYRLDRTESLQMQLRQWVRALARLEQAFWDRY